MNPAGAAAAVDAAPAGSCRSWAACALGMQCRSRPPARSMEGGPVHRRLVPLVAAALCALPAHAADPQMRFEKYRLPNGLKVVLTEDHRLPQVAVNVSYHVGAANQTPGRSGFAHLFEHMMFTPTKHAKDPDAILESIGASGVNGSTGFDRTNYFETVPANELPAALWLESERMAFLLPTLDAEKLRIQRDVVSNER